MIRSAWDLEWEARLWRGARDAELRLLADITRPFNEIARKIGIAFRDVAAAMAPFAAAYERAMVSLGRGDAA